MTSKLCLGYGGGGRGGFRHMTDICVCSNPVLQCQYSHLYLYQPSVAMSVLTLISVSTQFCQVSTHTYICINPVLPSQYSHLYLYQPSVAISVLTLKSVSTQCCHINTHVVLIKNPEHQGREFGWVPLREELLVYLDEALQ